MLLGLIFLLSAIVYLTPCRDSHKLGNLASRCSTLMQIRICLSTPLARGGSSKIALGFFTVKLCTSYPCSKPCKWLGHLSEYYFLLSIYLNYLIVYRYSGHVYFVRVKLKNLWTIINLPKYYRHVAYKINANYKLNFVLTNVLYQHTFYYNYI